MFNDFLGALLGTGQAAGNGFLGYDSVPQLLGDWSWSDRTPAPVDPNPAALVPQDIGSLIQQATSGAMQAFGQAPGASMPASDLARASGPQGMPSVPGPSGFIPRSEAAYIPSPGDAQAAMLGGQAAYPQNQGLMDALAAIQGLDWSPRSDDYQRRQYYANLTSGGTGAQNARFEALFDPSAVQADATAALAADPQFGHLFGGGSDPTVAQYGPVPGTVDDTYSEVASRPGLSVNVGRTFDSTGEEQAWREQRLQNRLDRRAEEAQALENMRWSASDFMAPETRMAMAWEMANAEAQWQRQQQADAMKRLQLQAEQDAAREDRALSRMGIEADIAHNKGLLGIEETKANAAIEQAKAEAARQGRLDEVTIAQLKAQIAALEADQARQLPYNAEDVALRANLRALHGEQWPKYYKEETGAWPKGVPDPVGGGMDTYGGTVYSPGTGATGGGQFSLLPRTGMTIPETAGVTASDILGDPWSNYDEFYEYGVPNAAKDRMDRMAGGAGWFGGGDRDGLDAEIDKLRNPDGSPLTIQQRSAIRRHFFGWGSGGDALTGMLGGGLIGAGVLSGNSVGPDYGSLYY